MAVPPIDPKETVQQYAALIEEARRDLRARIEFNIDVLEVPRRSDQAVRLWYTYLGVLAWDVSGSVPTLLEAGDVRTVVILNRCLLEYLIRIRYHEKRRS